MKRYVMLVVSITLIITSLIYLPENAKPAIVAGAGNGTNSEVATVEELDSLLDYLSSRNQKTGTASSNTLTGTGIRLFSNRNDDESNKVNPHTSATMQEDTYLKSTITQQEITEYDYIGGNHSYRDVGVQETHFNRTLTIYMTEEDTYYVSKGTLRSEYINLETHKITSETIMDFDIQIYYNDSKCLMKFNKFKIKYDEEDYTFDSSIMGKWIEFPEEAAVSIIGLVDQANRSALSEIQNCLDNDLKGFEKKGDKYTKETKTYEEKDTVFVADLSDPEYPFISMSIDSHEAPYIVKMRDKLTFYNIDNTVINVNFGDVEVMDMEDFEEMLGGI